MVGRACDALIAGLDSRSLRVLAGLTAPDPVRPEPGDEQTVLVS